MKKNVLVTLADSNYINQAKQLFSSAYNNGGWKDDMLLLSVGIKDKDLSAFKNQGIIVKKCHPIKKKDKTNFPTTILSKFDLFTSYFKKWEHVIFLDADIIVLASLDGLINDGFYATEDFTDLKGQFNIINFNKLQELSFLSNKDYKAFNVGLMSFSTNIISINLYDNIVKRYNSVGKYTLYPEQAIFNLVFRDKWKKLSRLYALSPSDLYNKTGIKLNKLKAITLHFEGRSIWKPWNKHSNYNHIWNSNLLKFKLINKQKNNCENKYSKFSIIFLDMYYELLFIIKYFLYPKKYITNFLDKVKK
ncbi:MAG: glycosyltransferase [Candidatus Woesearchaeota archaeon]